MEQAQNAIDEVTRLKAELEAVERERDKLQNMLEQSMQNTDNLIYWVAIQAMNRNPDLDNPLFDHFCISAYEYIMRYLLDRGIITKDQCNMEPPV